MGTKLRKEKCACIDNAKVEKTAFLEGCKEEETKEDKNVCKDNAKAMFLALKDKCKAIFEAGMAALDEEVRMIWMKKARRIWMMGRRAMMGKMTMLLKREEIRKKQWNDIDITYYQTC